MKKYPLLDVLRMLCACLVVMIHVGTSESTPGASMLVCCFARQAVPFFFVVSGFFFCVKLDQSNRKKEFVAHYVKRMLLFYILWVVISLPQMLSAYLIMYEGRSWGYIATILLRRIALAGAGQFWYLIALAETALIAGILLMKRKETWLYLLSVIGMCLNILYLADPPGEIWALYHRGVYLIFSWNNNFLMLGIPFFTIGVFFARNQNSLHYPAGRVVSLYALVSILAVVCYVLLIRKGMDPERFMFFFIAQAILLFLIGINAKYVSITNAWCEVLRSCSSAVYCLHNLVIEYFLGEIMPWSEHFIINYIAVLMVCILLFAVIRISKIKPLYSLISLK